MKIILSLFVLFMVIFSACTPKKEVILIPFADFDIKDRDSLKASREIIFTNKSQNANVYTWDFGDGNATQAESPKHKYDKTGVYTVRLIAKGDGGTHAAEKTIAVTALPTADFDYLFVRCDTAACELSFTNKSTNATSYLWDFGNGKSSKEKSPKFKYTESGVYVVRLNVRGAGESAETLKTVEINILPKPVSADFEVQSSTSSKAPTEVTFTNKSRNADTFSWDFGDGNISILQTPKNTYQRAGIYTVRLTASGKGGIQTVIKTILIN